VPQFANPGPSFDSVDPNAEKPDLVDLLRKREQKWDKKEVEVHKMIDLYTLEVKLAKEREEAFLFKKTEKEKEEGDSEQYKELHKCLNDLLAA